MSNYPPQRRLATGAPSSRANQPDSVYRTNCQPCKSGLILSASACLIEIAQSIAYARMTAHNGTRKPGEDFGSVGNWRADYFGVLAEGMVVTELFECGLTPTGFIFYRPTPQPGPDFLLNGQAFNIKSSRPGSNFFCVSDKQRIGYQQTGVLILPVGFDSNTTARVFRPLTPERVGDWPLRKGLPGRGDYRSFPIGRLTPLTDLADLETMEANR